MPMKEGRRNDRERIRDRETRGKRGGGGGREARSGGEGEARGRSLNGDRPTTVPTELLAVVRRFRESNLSCDHLRECLNELLGVGPGERETPRVFGNFYRRDILYGNAGPTGIRGEPKPHGGGYRRGKEEDLSPSSSLSLYLSPSFPFGRRRDDGPSRLTSQLVYCSIRVHG